MLHVLFRILKLCYMFARQWHVGCSAGAVSFVCTDTQCHKQDTSVCVYNIVLLANGILY